MNLSNKIQETFDDVKCKPELKLKTKDYLNEIRLKKNGQNRFNHRKNLIVAFVSLIFVVGIGSYSFLMAPFSYVSVDVNPSLELVLNRLDWVIEAKAYNEDGEVILSDVSLKGMNYKDAITCLAKSEKMKEYLDQDSVYNFTIASGSSHKEAELCLTIESLSSVLDYPYNSIHSDLHCVEEAHKEDLSLGKYTAYQELLQYDSTITIEDCHHMSVEEMHHQTETHKSNCQGGMKHHGGNHN